MDCLYGLFIWIVYMDCLYGLFIWIDLVRNHRFQISCFNFSKRNTMSSLKRIILRVLHALRVVLTCGCVSVIYLT